MQSLAGPLVLVVDDQVENVQALEAILTGVGYEVATAVSGAQALIQAEKNKPSLVLLDMLMPVMDGFEVCRKLRENPRTADVPVIFLSGSNDHEGVARAFGTGAVDYVIKPFVVQELLARIRTHIELKRSRDRLQEMVREREDTTHVVAHDLKNPLTCILFAAKSLRKASDDARRTELVDDIESCSEEALSFINRFLARGAEGQRLRQFRPEPSDLSVLTRETFQLVRWAANAFGVGLRLEGGPTPVLADPMAARNVLHNLVSNAIRHSPIGEEVVVEVGPGRDGFARCLVMDRGPGIPEEDLGKLFKPFVRLKTSKTDKTSSGLGLSIAKHDLGQMGGDLRYEPRPGGGSIFAVELPGVP